MEVPQRAASEVAGVDVGARRLHCVWLDSDGRLREADVIDVGQAGGLERAVERLAPAGVVAIDAPEKPTTEPHASDPAPLSPKFRTARCAEIALGREHGIWVPWVTPQAERAPQWMHVGFELFRRLAECGTRAIEVYPYGAFRTLADRQIRPGQSPGGTIESEGEGATPSANRLAPKRTLEGRLQRIWLLRELHAGEPSIDRSGLEGWSHDMLDALIAAEIALDCLHGRAQRVPAGEHTHDRAHGQAYDGSAIWLPGVKGRDLRSQSPLPARVEDPDQHEEGDHAGDPRVEPEHARGIRE